MPPNDTLSWTLKTLNLLTFPALPWPLRPCWGYSRLQCWQWQAPIGVWSTVLRPFASLRWLPWKPFPEELCEKCVINNSKLNSSSTCTSCVPWSTRSSTWLVAEKGDTSISIYFYQITPTPTPPHTHTALHFYHNYAHHIHVAVGKVVQFLSHWGCCMCTGMVWWCTRMLMWHLSFFFSL